MGTSDLSTQDAWIAVESNYFYRCSGEAEIVSNKSAENTYRYNTFVECAGSLTMRHGRGCTVEGNVFFGNTRVVLYSVVGSVMPGDGAPGKKASACTSSMI